MVNEYKKKRHKIIPKKTQYNKVVLSYNYPGGQSFNKEFKSKFFEEVSSLLNKDHHWLFQYVGETSKLGKENKLLSTNFTTFSFLDAYFTYMDFLKSCSYIFKD